MQYQSAHRPDGRRQNNPNCSTTTSSIKSAVSSVTRQQNNPSLHWLRDKGCKHIPEMDRCRRWRRMLLFRSCEENALEPNCARQDVELILNVLQVDKIDSRIHNQNKEKTTSCSKVLFYTLKKQSKFLSN